MLNSEKDESPSNKVLAQTNADEEVSSVNQPADDQDDRKMNAFESSPQIVNS